MKQGGPESDSLRIRESGQALLLSLLFLLHLKMFGLTPALGFAQDTADVASSQYIRVCVHICCIFIMLF